MVSGLSDFLSNLIEFHGCVPPCKIFNVLRLCRCQLMKNDSEHQSKCHAKKGIYNTQDHRSLEPIDPGAQHQCAETIHGRFIPVVGAKSQAQSPQWAHQCMKRFRRHQIKGKKRTGTRNRPHDPLPEADSCIAGVWIFR